MTLSSRESLVAITVVVAVAAFIAGYSVSYIYTRPLIEELGSQIDDLSVQLDRAERRLLEEENERARLGTLLAETEKRLSEARRTIADKQAEIDRLAGRLEREVEESRETVSRLESKLSNLRGLSERLHKAAALLTQLRSLQQISSEREEALNYWTDIKALATEFDSALTPSVDKIINNIDGWVQYNDWLSKAPGPGASNEEIVSWLLEYPESANSYFDAVQQFVDEVHTTIASKIIGLRDLF